MASVLLFKSTKPCIENFEGEFKAGVTTNKGKRALASSLLGQMTSYRLIKQGPLANDLIRFVVVDDSEPLLQIWRRVFSIERSCTCLLTTSPPEAIQEIEIHGADILLTDFEMPEMNGAELASKVKQISPQTRILFTTGEVALLEKYGHLFEKFEVIQKPYSNIFNIQSFIHNLVNRSPLNHHQGKFQGSIFVWSF